MPDTKGSATASTPRRGKSFNADSAASRMTRYFLVFSWSITMPSPASCGAPHFHPAIPGRQADNCRLPAPPNGLPWKRKDKLLHVFQFKGTLAKQRKTTHVPPPKLGDIVLSILIVCFNRALGEWAKLPIGQTSPPTNPSSPEVSAFFGKRWCNI